ncbi:MAG: ABC transporter substrate-binding protein [Chloroflexi bacterium]|nr:ABC transporter substrate-binding protein [Chloroflexota bacterium]MCY4106402.1 ABC transporter substrate-binding protein [Chloroflexota bacterium]
MNYKKWLLGCLLVLLVCTPLLAQEETDAMHLRVGTLHLLERLIFQVAFRAGYFEEAGLTLEVVESTSGKVLQEATVAGELDGFQMDVVSALKVNASAGADEEVRVVRHIGVLNIPSYAIIVGPGSTLADVRDLAGANMGISHNTIIEYLADALLASAGVEPDEVEYEEVALIPVRYEQTILRQVESGLLPSPYLDASLQYGAEVLLDDTVLDYVPKAIAFSTRALTEKPAAVRAFLAAYERAVETVNAMAGNTLAFREFSDARQTIRPSAMESMIYSGQIALPLFSRAGVPSADEFNLVQDWALAKGVIPAAQAYEDVIDDSLLPAVTTEELTALDALVAAFKAAQPAAEEEMMGDPDLRIGVLPVLNALPAYVAQDAGYFAEEGIEVEIRIFLSAKELSEEVMAGGMDGLQADLITALRINDGGGDVKTLRHVGITNQPFVQLVVARDSGIESLADLAGTRIAISKNTVIEYLTDSFLASAGLSADDAEYVEIPKLVERYNAILRGLIDAASLPQPFATIALSYGARALIDDTVMDYVPEALSVRADVLAEKGEIVSAFLRAYERAVATLNAMDGDNDQYLALADAVNSKPDSVVKSMVAGRRLPVPSLAWARVPEVEEYASAHDWALENGLLMEAQAYEDIIDGSYLPEPVAEE